MKFCPQCPHFVHACQNTRGRKRKKKRKIMDFKTYHAQKEELRRQCNIDMRISGNTVSQKYIEDIKRQKQRDVDYILWLFNKDTQKKSVGRNR